MNMKWLIPFILIMLAFPSYENNEFGIQWEKVMEGFGGEAQDMRVLSQ